MFCHYFIGKATHSVQLKVKSLEMHQSPPLAIQSRNKNVTLSCSAYGNVNKMSGQVTTLSGDPISYRSTTTKENLFIVKAYIEASGTYVCKIQSGKEKVQAVTSVQIYSRKTFYIRC